jgi:2-oxoglutarate ferredoxin oxidoreductase subunit alpha
MSNKAPINGVNDFVVQFANVNGSGSASANELFARSVLRMGIPVRRATSFRRISRDCRPGTRCISRPAISARGGAIMVAMNPQTWDKDVAGSRRRIPVLRPTKPMPKSKFREDITSSASRSPRSAIVNTIRANASCSEHHLCRRASALLDMDVRRSSSSSAAVQVEGEADRRNMHARLGRDWALMNLQCPIGLKLQRSTRSATSFRRGNSAAALGAVQRRHRLRLVPSRRSSLADAFTGVPAAADPVTKQERCDCAGRGRARLNRHGDRRRLGQGAGVYRHIGSRHLADAGVPGLAYFAEIPRSCSTSARRTFDRHAVPRPTMRPDLLRHASHGDTKHVLLFPEDPAEAFDFGATAFDLADRLQTRSSSCSISTSA